MSAGAYGGAPESMCLMTRRGTSGATGAGAGAGTGTAQGRKPAPVGARLQAWALRQAKTANLCPLTAAVGALADEPPTLRPPAPR